MIALSGDATLDGHDRRWLQSPCVGGVILFARNFVDSAQLRRLTADIRLAAGRPLLVAVDQEGGRIQRFVGDGFTALPSMAAVATAEGAASLATATGLVLAAELLAHGVDLSFTPVLDVAHGHSEVIGSRAFSAAPEEIAVLAAALTAGLRQAGMAACGKHFPGHGFVAADSHVDFPVDGRELAEMEACDLLPFRDFVDRGGELLMTAHVTYPAVDSLPATFSAVWLQRLLRQKMGYCGWVVSDDLSMAGATAAGDIGTRLRRAAEAGCDLFLVCQPTEVEAAIAAGEAGASDGRGWLEFRRSTGERVGVGEAAYRRAKARLDGVATE